MPLPVISHNTEVWIQVASWIVAIFGGIGALVNFVAELRRGRKQRERELRWKQAEVGKALTGEMLKKPAWIALQMLDAEGEEFGPSPETRVVISHQDISRALAPPFGRTLVPPFDANSEKVTYIRDCFDSLFHYMSLFQHYTTNGLVRHEDVESPLDYYIRILATLRSVVDAYLSNADVGYARHFLATYPVWMSPPSGERALPGQYLGTEIDEKRWSRHYKGGLPARGNGECWIAPSALYFRRHRTKTSLVIPFGDVLDVKVGKWHAGRRDGGEPAVEIVWKGFDVRLCSRFVFSLSVPKTEALIQQLRSSMRGSRRRTIQL